MNKKDQSVLPLIDLQKGNGIENIITHCLVAVTSRGWVRGLKTRDPINDGKIYLELYYKPKFSRKGKVNGHQTSNEAREPR